VSAANQENNNNDKIIQKQNLTKELKT